MSVNRGIYRGLTPKITWGTSFPNTLVLDRALDDAMSYGDVVEPTSILPCENGEVEGCSAGWREYLTGIVHRIPRLTTNGITGWEGATGWDEFLAEAREGEQFRFYPDATSGTYFLCELAEETEEGHDEETNRYRMIRLTIRTVDNSPITGY